MGKREWKKRYKDQLIETAGITAKFAEEVYQAGIEDHDFNDDPEYAALEELSYWTDRCPCCNTTELRALELMTNEGIGLFLECLVCGVVFRDIK